MLLYSEKIIYMMEEQTQTMGRHLYSSYSYYGGRNTFYLFACHDRYFPVCDFDGGQYANEYSD